MAQQIQQQLERTRAVAPRRLRRRRRAWGSEPSVAAAPRDGEIPRRLRSGVHGAAAKGGKRLGLKPLETLEFDLADGTSVTRKISEARFAFQGKQRTSPVVLGVEGDMPLLGVVTLETMGLVLNPLKRELVPIRAVLARTL
jgi:hypothetical protein